MDDLIQEFIAETTESLSELDLDLVKLEQDPGNTDLLGRIFRLMHTIKGTCGFLGLPRLEKVAHAAENLLDLFRSGDMDVTQDRMTLLFQSIDRVRYIVAEIENTGVEPEGDDDDLIAKLEAEVSGQSVEEEGSEDPVVFDDVTEPAVQAESAAPSPQDPPAVDVTPVSANNEQQKQNNQNSQKAKAATEKNAEFLRVQVHVLEDLINMVSELVLTRNQLLQLVRLSNDVTVDAPLQRLNRIVSDLQEGVMKTRMQPIGNAWSKLPRIVRDLTMDLGKKITLEMSGEETELDRQVLEMIKDPLTHMVRNSCDHGIEMPEDRLAAGKPETGTIHLKAYHEGGFIIVDISDDGKGLNPQAIGDKALEKGLIDDDQRQTMSDKQLLQNIFKAGFSTAETVTNVSGRGVGMDVVRTNIEKIGGTIDMDSVYGKGTKFKIQIPLTLAIISALILEIDDCRYAMPQLNIQELVRINPGDDQKIEMINDKPVFRLRGKILPLIDSKTLFSRVDGEERGDEAVAASLQTDVNGAPDPSALDPNEGQFDIGNKLIVVVAAGASHFGLVVDAIHDIEEIVIKSISSVLSDTAIFAGNTILGDGQAIMILDPAGIASRFEVSDNMQKLDDMAAGHDLQDERRDEKTAMLVFHAGRGAPKAIPLALISRLQQFHAEDISHSGDSIVVRFEQMLLPLGFVENEQIDISSGMVTTLILADDVSHAAFGLMIDSVVDIVETEVDLTTSTARDGVIGSMTIDGKVVDVVDITHYLDRSKEDFFSVDAHAGTPFAGEDKDGNVVPVQQDGVSALIVDDSPFFRNMLSPILRAAGYRVTVSEDAVAAISLHDKGKMFDVILSDIEMPQMTGYEFVEKMRADSAWKDLPFIALTSHTTPQDIEYGYQKGFTEYIGKLNKDELIRTMRSVLAKKEVKAS